MINDGHKGSADSDGRSHGVPSSPETRLHWSAPELLGDSQQLAWVQTAAFTDGPQAGTRFVDVRIAGGLHALILPDRGMDLGQVWYQGFPLAWLSGTGVVNPAYATGDDWLRLFHGGLMTGAGLENVGYPSQVGEMTYGLHGRLSLTPARNVHWWMTTEPDRSVVIRGTVRETAVHGADLELERTYRFSTREPRLEIHDSLTNRGYEPAPALLLYHFNVGYPVVAPGAKVIAPAHKAKPLDTASAPGVAQHLEVVGPQADAVPEVFELQLTAGHEKVTVGVVNARFAPTDGIAVTVTYDRRQLPRLWQWRMMGLGRYLVGIEPSTCGLGGRADVLSTETPPILQPGERTTYDLVVAAATGDSAREFHAEAPSQAERGSRKW